MIDVICTRLNPNGTVAGRGQKNRSTLSIPDFVRDTKLVRHVRSWGRGFNVVRVEYFVNKEWVRTVYFRP